MHRRFMESFSQCITVGPKSELPPSAETVATPNDSKYSGSICNASQERHVQRIRSAPSKMQSPQTLLKTQSQKLQKIETREINSGSIHYVDLREKSRPASANESKEGEICRQGKSVKNQQRPRMEKVEPFATSWIKQYMSDMIEKDEIIEAAVETAAAGQNFRRLSAVERTSVVYRLRSNLSDRQAKGQNIIRIEPAMLALKKQGYERTKEEVQLIFQIARSLPAFHNLNDLYLIQICKVLKHARFMKDEIIFNQGDEGKEWYIILYGSVSIHISSTGDPKDNRFIRTMGYGQGFGDIALINRCHRTATVKSNQTTDVLIVEKFEFDRMLKGIYINEVNTIELFLRKVPIFNEREVQSLRAIAQQMARRSYQPKQAIYVEGEDLDTIYFLKTGVVSVVSSYRPSNSHRKEYLVLGVIHPLQYFGQEGFQRNPKFKSVSAHTTMIAGDATKMTQDEIGISITLRSLYKTNRDFHDAAISKNPLTSNHGAKPLSHIENNSVEVVEIEYAHAMEIINELPWMPWNYTTRQDLAKLKHSDTRWRKWEKLKEHEMNMLVKEKFGDPNMTIQQARKTRKNARTHKSSKPKPKD
ncbi:hypothetical protein BC830DRAFT_694560 [Chytriomyces sp. MP71]|nr:hypothetical protein BC830DRAFT_694560 [Chytriomyces sp. MP71]